MKNAGRWALLLVAALAVVACGGPTEVQIGAIVALQGSAAPYGESVWRGIQVAQGKINDEGGVTVAETSTAVPLNIVMRDSRSDPSIAIQEAEELIGMGIPAVIGAVSSDVTLAIADLFQQSEVVLLSPATSTPELSTKGSYIYRNFPSDELEAVNMANHIYNVAGIRMVDVVSSQSKYGLGIRRAFIERFRMLGGRVGATPSFPIEGTDMTAVVDELTGSDSGGIYIAGYSDETARVAIAVRDAGITKPLFGTGAILPNELVAEGGAAVEGLAYPTPAFDPDSEDPAVREFIRRYREMFGEDFDVYAAHGYDAVLILAQAIEQEGYRGDSISFYLNAMNPFPGAAGETTFDEEGNARKFHRMFVIQNGTAVPYVAPAGDDSGQ
ncbi:MAG: penicillin-binding protein activator [Acidobacteriota bacterium]|jgi:branched-chain amino acid transport system substrate-binding protein